MVDDIFPREWFKNYELIKIKFHSAYNYPEFDTLRDEVCKCLILDLNLAAITLTNHLFEDFLKKMLIYNNAQKDSESIIGAFDSSTAEFDGITLFNSIEKAFKEKIITEDQKNRLHQFRNEFRNPYSHAESKKIFNGLTLGVQEVKFENDKFNTSDYKQQDILKLPFVHGLVKIKIAKEIATEYFNLVDEIIREILEKRKTSP